MRNMGPDPDGVTFICVLKACGSIGAIEKGRQIHAEIDKKGLLKTDVAIGTALVDMYAKCGALAAAQEIFDELPSRNVVSWNVLISGYVHHGSSDKALKCYSQMQNEGLSPNAITYVSALKACAITQALEKGEQIHFQASQKENLNSNVVLGTALIHMYTECGALAKARQVFSGLRLPDVAAWTALMAGYANQGLGNEALDLYEQMQDQYVTPNAQTFVCVLKACGDLKELEKGRKIHAEIRRQESMQKNILVMTALIDMYFKCNEIAIAQELFDEMPTHDAGLWNALIGGYAQQGLGNESLKCFRRMQCSDISPNPVTFINALKACISLGALDMGEDIHREVCRRGFLKMNVAVGNALVDMYLKCGTLEKAQEVFNQLPTYDATSWNTIITGYTQQGRGEEALECFDQMQNSGFTGDIVTYISILKACGITRAIERGKDIHELIKVGFLKESTILGTTLVDMYVKFGMLIKAHKVFQELPACDVASWNALISGYVQDGQGFEALDLLEQMQSKGFVPNAVTFVSICKACGMMQKADKCKEVHSEIIKMGLLQDNPILGNALVDMYMKCGALTEAIGVFEKLIHRDTASWNAMIGGFSSYGLGSEAWTYYEKMHAENQCPDTLTYISVLQACGVMGSLENGQKIHDEISMLGLLKKNLVLGTALVDMYVKCGAFVKAQHVFNEIPSRDVACWNALMVGYAHYELSDELLKCFSQMQYENIVPDVTTIICVLKACGSLGARSLGEQIHKEVSSQGLAESNIILGNALIDMYAKCGLLTKAHQVFVNLPARNIVSWTSLLAGYAQLGKADYVLDSFNVMINECVDPNEVTFVVLLTACSHAGFFEEGQRLFRDMSDVYSILPSLEHYTCIIDLYSRVGLLDEVLGIIELMKFTDSIQLWLPVLGACQNWVHLELGGWAFTHALKVDDRYASTYVSMSNIYSAA
ncbi:hypothetical protein KP509_13G011700 [Ceratopteris richardii]|nr:hypothetical protein KP509_13G011700 [Ceratopteris richardii]